jgi:hypothetical protein
LQDLVQRLKTQAAEIHARARCDATEHDLLCKNIKHAALHGRLKIARGCCKVARNDCEDVI